MGDYVTLSELDQPKQQGGYVTLSQLQKLAPLSAAEKFGQGMRDPIDGGAQLLTNMLPDGVVRAGNTFNNWLADKTGLVGRLPEGGVDQQVRQQEAEYQARRAAGGESGLDAWRMGGNVLSPANLAVSARLPAAATMAGKVGFGAAGGAATGALNPVTEGDDYWSEKGKQALAGGAAGGATPVVMGGLARVVSPNASTNPNLQLLKNEGVQPTVGQTLGGRWNALEEKAQSIPIIGDAIAAARGRSLEQFNNAAINRATAPVGVRIDGTGQQAVRDAGDALSQAYQNALGQVKAVRLDPQFQQDLTQLYQSTRGLTPTMRDRFDAIVADKVASRFNGGNTIPGATFKDVDSELGQLAAKWSKSSMASESELGDALASLQAALKQQVMRSHPGVAQALDAADKGWANLVRVEGAAKIGKNGEGLFTPGQLNTAIQSADDSVRNRAVSRGTALMQDLGNAGQQVLGNKVPNSFTTDRMLWSGGVLGGAGLVSPAAAAGVLGGAAMYTPPAQALLRGLLSSRPQSAKAIADALRQASPMFVPFGAEMGLGLLK
jgi:hypothetical protein